MLRLFIFLLTSFAALHTKAQTWKTFADTSILFTAKYPSNWANKIKEGKRVFFTSPLDNASDKFAENININVTQNPRFGTDIKITGIYSAIIDNLKPAFTEFTLESQRYFKWNNQETCEIIYTGYNNTDLSIKVRHIQWFCFYKTRLYTLTFTSEAASTTHTETAKKIMTGIVFTR